MKVRYEMNVVSDSRSQYDKCTISILDYEYIGGGKTRFNSLTPIGRITYQRTKGEDRWYGFMYTIEADLHRPDQIERMARLARFVYDNMMFSDMQPSDFITLVGGEEYFRHNGSYLPVSMVGNRYYKVIRDSDGEYLTNIIAPSDKLAEKQLKKLKNPKDGQLRNSLPVTMTFSHVITL